MRNKPLTLSFPLDTRLAAGLLLLALVAAAALIAVPAEAGKGHDDMSWVQVYPAGSKDKAYLGVKLQALTDDLRDGLGIKAKSGVLVSEVIEDGPAAKAGLQDGDVIVEYNRKKVETPQELMDLVRETPIGDEVRIKIVRDNKTKSFDVALAEWPDEPTVAFGMPDDFDFSEFSGPIVRVLQGHRLGVRLWEMDENLAPYFGVDEGEGLLVLSVEDESTAAKAGIKTGDVITAIDAKAVTSVDEVREKVNKFDKGDDFVITVVRKKKEIKLDAEMQESGVMQLGRNFRAPRWRYHMNKVDDRDLRQELDELREELEELKKELEED